MDALRAAAIALYDRYTHEERGVDRSPGAISDCRGQSDPPLDRRAFMAELTRLAGGGAAAAALLTAIAADPAAAALIPTDDRRVTGRRMRWRVGSRSYEGYQAEPRQAKGPVGSVLVIHENRGLNAHIEDVARRLAVAGYRALAADFLAPGGGTPPDQDAARAAIGKLDLSQSAADAVVTLAILKALPGANGRVGAVGFCWGGGMVNRVAVAAGRALDAGSPFYGPAPDPALAPRVEAAMLLHYAERDERVNATGIPWAAALKEAGKNVQSHIYPGVEHAFHNDTSAERYDEAAAKLAWQRTLDFFAATIR